MSKKLKKPTHPPAKVDCVITVVGNRAFMDGDYPLSVIRDNTSYLMEGFRFSQAYRNRAWDGRKHLFHQATRSFPAGLLPAVNRALVDYNPDAKITVIDKREDSVPIIQNNGYHLETINFGEGIFDYQLEAVNKFKEAHRGILKIAVNGGKSSCAAALIQDFGVKTLFLVDNLELISQTRLRFSQYLNISEGKMGVIGDGQFSLGDFITLATPDTLINRLADSDVRKFLNSIDFVIGDEIHHGGSETSYAVLEAIPAYYRLGLSGTPLDRSDGADLRIIAQMGEVFYEVTNKTLIERGVSVQPHVEVIKIDKPVLPSRLKWQAVHKLGVVENVLLNTTVVDKVKENVDKKLQVLVLIEHIQHGVNVKRLLQDKHPNIRTQFINGQEDVSVRQVALNKYKDGKIDCLIATSILDEGVDVPCIDVLILAAGGKSKIRLLQRVGRGLRTGQGKDKLLVIDFANFCHKHLLKHSMQRLKIYKQEECFLIKSV